ncbi:GNAT family N-acetyltransferase [Romboutsia lituseburensis]|uniref:Protein N-acetyltransferase, RimJ/RimL family n=1 Tax=Romboutsia lituseburensis DSM 797 TaxID=1121325 RepID=A0A1G9N2Q3_9FIRM|nr:GNAT family protein [Romboutsia lituseburensis]CEH34228.1 GNAT acetyltransferase [Romboutsia lituseburensis]SDL80407.1 Protein N-acetyltransferase, RimJ/RimL family [Romboutsia lituseburensis DSM 797]
MHNSNNFKMKTLETSRCILRPISLEDAPYLFDYYQKDIVVKYLPFKPHKTISDTKKFIKLFFLKNYKEGKIGHYAIVLKEENVVVGNVGFNNISPSSKEGEMGICINPYYWGYNLSTELAKEMIRYGFEDLGLQKIFAITFEDNKYSQKPLEVLGFNYIKTFNKKLYSKNQYVKCHRYEMLRSSYIKNKPKLNKKG